MTANQLKQRWLDNEFVESIKSVLSEIIETRQNRNPVDLRGITLVTVVAPREGHLLDEVLLKAHFYGVSLHDVDLSFSKIYLPLTSVSFLKVNFTQCFFDCSMSRSHFQDCVFDNSKMIISADDAQFHQCSFVGVTFSGRSSQISGGMRTLFENCDFTDTNFRKVQFRGAKFANCCFKDAKFDNCDFRASKFEGQIPSESQFTRSNLKVAKFNGEPVPNDFGSR